MNCLLRMSRSSQNRRWKVIPGRETLNERIQRKVKILALERQLRIDTRGRLEDW